MGPPEELRTLATRPPPALLTRFASSTRGRGKYDEPLGDRFSQWLPTRGGIVGSERTS